MTYKHTVFACYFANFFQAIGCVFPILLIPLRTSCGLSYTQFGILVSLNFMTQVTSDILFSKPVEKYGFRIFAVLAPLASSLGLFIFAASPLVFANHVFVGFCIGTFLFAAAAGLQELLLSPIVDALPMEETQRGKNMSMLHSFYAWGQIFVILCTTGLLALIGSVRWQLILCIWAAMPLVSSVLFLKVPLQRNVSGKEAMKIRELLKSKIFWLVVAAIVFGGAAEVTMGQWASAFMERGLNISKTLGDLLGMCGFALMLAVGRTGYGIWGDRISIHKVMLFGSMGAVLLYLTAGLSAQPILGLIACGLTGLCVSMLWPGCIIVAGRGFKMAGASMYALLSAAGDVGASAGAFTVGRIADKVTRSSSGLSQGNLTSEQLGLRTGMIVAALFPLFCFFTHVILLKYFQEKSSD